jgi:hypothetical protein
VDLKDRKKLLANAINPPAHHLGIQPRSVIAGEKPAILFRVHTFA